jgi:uncharacterized protein
MQEFIPITIAASGIVFAAFFIRSLTGFGSALVSVPFLALLFDLKFAVPLESLLEVGLSVLLLGRVWRSIRFRILLPLAAGTVIGSLPGAYILHAFANLFLKRMLGVAVILFAVNLMWKGSRRAMMDPSPRWGVAAGMIGGLFGGLFGTSGPPFVMYLTAVLKKKEEIRASLIGLFAVDYAWRAMVYAATGLVTAETLTFVLVLTPALVAGTLLGHRIHVNVGEERYRQVVAAILGVSGVLLLVR